MSLEQLTLSDEQVQDIVGSLINGSSNADAVYDDVNNTLTVSLSDSISVNTLEATDSITDPKGNTVTSLSDPVRVTEEASTFTESDVSLTLNQTVVQTGQIELGFSASTTADRVDDASQKSTTSTGKGLEIEPQASLGGVKTTVSSLAGGFNEIVLTDPAENILDSVTGSFTSGDTVTLTSPLTPSSKYYIAAYNGGSNYTEGLNISTSFPYTSGDIDITSGVSHAHPDDGKDADLVSEVYNFDTVTALAGDATSGNALVSFDSGAPDDIDSYDLATFQRTLDSETVTVDVEDSTGTVLKSDISKDTDISGIGTSKDVQLRVNLSRSNTANNPTVDYLARRFTR